MNEISLGRRLSDVVAEYDHKLAAIPEAIEAFNKAGSVLKTAVSIAGEYGRENIDTGRVYDNKLASHLLKSAWYHIYDKLQISYLASADDKRIFEQEMASPPPFTMDNLRATFGRYIEDPRGNILRGLAEVFCQLDPAYKSHDKVKIGVKGLPKRVILSNVGGYGSYGRDRLVNIINALAAYQGKPLLNGTEIAAIMDDGEALRHGGVIPASRYRKEETVIARGVWLKRFQNGNGHLFFDDAELRDINHALAEYYGDVLPDTADEKPAKRQESTAVSKDLQYYPTPDKVVERVLAELYDIKGQRVLEPSCGCGRFMDAIRAKGAEVIGCEVDPVRASMCEAKGHRVMRMNFLETVPTPNFDHVVMNPPFYGRHYAKHVNHALKFLKPGGRLTAILPATARYDHGLVDGRWNDLPVGSFSESGTNINTTVLTIFAEKIAEKRAA